MTHLIDKSYLVANIKKKIKAHKEALKNCDSDISELVLKGSMSAYQSLLYLLDTFDTKEVDLDKEAEFIANDIMIGVQANRYNTVVYNTKRSDFNHSHLMLAARKGIELGLKAGNSVDNKAQKGE